MVLGKPLRLATNGPDHGDNPGHFASCSLQGHLEDGHQEGRQLDLGCFGLPGTFNMFPEAKAGGWRC
ncbi:hypothetical protein WJX79_006200 [Trebouxia sp. C0005]